MRWQKTARLAIATFVIVFGAMVIIALWRPATPRIAETSPREDAGTIVETRGTADKPLVIERSGPDGKVQIRITAEKQRTYPDGRNVFLNGTITLPERNGRTLDIRCGEMEAIVPQKESRPVDTAKCSHGVKLTTDDGLDVTSDNATYDEKSGMLAVPGEVQFKKGRLTGSGFGASYDRERNVLWLLQRARMNVTPDEQGKGAAEATAGAAGLARNEHYVRLTTNAHIVSEGRTLDADDMTIQLTPDDRLIQTTSLRGNSRITGSPGTGGAEGMSARDIDLTYGPDGRTLQQAKLAENAVAQLAGASGTGTRKVAGRTIDISLGPDGTTITALTANENVQVDIPAAPDAPARRINASSLSAGGPSGLQTATFTGSVTYTELRAAGNQPAASDRTGKSERLVIETQPGLGAIQKADFAGNVHIVDGGTTADGRRAIYHVAEDKFDLVPSPDVPGPPPSVNDGRVLVNAGRITFTISTKKLSADTAVRSSLQPAKRNGASGKNGTKSEGKLPSVLKAGEVVYVTSNRLEYDGAAAQATYSGAARLWQDKTTIKGETILVDDRSGNLTATGRVESIMFFEEFDSATKTKKLVKMDASGDRMVYEDAKRVATYTSGPSGKAHIVSTQGDVVGDRIQLFLKPGVNELERAEADGQVTVKEGGRIATGNHLTYTAANETYVMFGTPLELEEKTPECRLTFCYKLTFKRNTVATQIEGNDLVPVTSKACSPK